MSQNKIKKRFRQPTGWLECHIAPGRDQVLSFFPSSELDETLARDSTVIFIFPFYIFFWHTNTRLYYCRLMKRWLGERERKKNTISVVTIHDSLILFSSAFWWLLNFCRLSPHPRTRKGCDLRHETVSWKWKKGSSLCGLSNDDTHHSADTFFSLFSREWCTAESTTARSTLTTAGVLASSWKSSEGAGWLDYCDVADSSR